ncbi:MAG: hypothetical protein U0Y82_05335 [Thermoleophilia bacterium]
MNSREGTKSGASSCAARLNCTAAAMAWAVHEPMRPWSYTGGHAARMSTEGGRSPAASRGAEYMWSRWSGRSGRHPKRTPWWDAGSPAGVVMVLMGCSS